MSALGESTMRDDDALLGTLRLRLLPFLLGLYLVAFIDRINLGFAALTMNAELALTSRQFGFAAGIFFWGYFLFEIPSNLMLHRIGARVWIARILATWGIVATLTGFVRSPQQLYMARFALGLAEAGYFPGIVLYLGYWFPGREKARAIALILIGMPLASVIGGPVSGLILDHAHWLGWSSWRWLLALEGLPALLCAPLAYLLLPSGPGEARFLTEAEKARVRAEVEREDARKAGPGSVGRTLIALRVWQLGAIGLSHAFAAYTFNFWLPQLMKAAAGARSNLVVGLLVMIPNLVGVAAMLLVARRSDRTQDRRLHMAACVALAGGALVLLGGRHTLPVSLLLFSIVGLGVYGFLPVFFAMPGEFLSGYAAAAGIALVTSVANLGGFVGPFAVGLIRERTGGSGAALVCAGAVLLLAAALSLALPKRADAARGETMSVSAAVT